MSNVQDTLAQMNAEEKAQVFVRAEMRLKIINALAEHPVKQEDLDWIRRLCDELKSRISMLTPNRTDLVDVWTREFDVDLFLQMMQHAAVDSADANQIVEIVFSRLCTYCAPVQDEAVVHAKTVILEEKQVPQKLALLLEISDQILTDIEKMIANFGA